MNVTNTTVITNLGGFKVEYKVNSFNELIHELERKGKLFCLCYDNIKVFHSLKNIIYDHKLKDNYTIVYFLNDREIVSEDVKQNKRYLEYASEGLKNDKEFVSEYKKQKN